MDLNATCLIKPIGVKAIAPVSGMSRGDFSQYTRESI